MFAYLQNRRVAEERYWAEADVKDAFKRWDTSEKARKQRKRPYFEGENAGTENAPAQSERPIDVRTMLNSFARARKQETGPKYEKVEGVVMDTLPGSRSTGPYGMEQTLPEVEAKAIREIPIRKVVGHTDSVEMEDAERTSISSSTASSSQPASQQFWSGSSESSSNSTQDSGLRPYQHVPTEYKPVTTTDDPGFGDPHDYTELMMPDDASTSVTRGPDTRSASSNVQHSAGPVMAKQLKLDVIEEEDKQSVPAELDSVGAPAPAAGVVEDHDIIHDHDGPAVSAASESQHTATAKPSLRLDTSPSPGRSPHRVLGAAGVGPDTHIYELEAAVPAEMSAVDDDSSTSKGSGLLGKVEHGISKAAHALHDKVKKNVTFSPVDDVRFMTPSPRASFIDTATAAEVDARQ